MKLGRFALAMLSGVSTLALASLAHAQTAAPQGATLDEVVVTGSRIIVNGNNSPTPVTVIPTAEVLTAQPQTVAQSLQSLPVFMGSQGPTTNVSGASANSGASVMNLRNIGQLRTLVLYDGKRVPPTAPTGLIDVNMIPQMLLQRVDVVTGGASAVYGSDAISGVVNFITDTKFNGLKVNAQTGVSQYGDDSMWSAGVAFGRDLFGGRGHFEASFEHYDDEGILTRYAARPWTEPVYIVTGGGTAANPFRMIRNARQSNFSYGGVIRTGAPVVGGVARDNFSQNGVLTPYVHGALTGTTGIESGGDGTFFFPASMKSALRSDQLFTRFDYDVTDTIHAYVQFAGTQNYNKQIWGPNSLNNLRIAANNPFLPPQIQALFPNPATSTFTFSKTLLNQVPVIPESEARQYYVLAGLNGDIGDKWRWDVSASKASARITSKQLGNMNNQRLYAALDSTINPATGQIVCRTDLTNPGLYPGCVPYNPFGPTSESAAALAYVSQVTGFTSWTTMEDVAGSLTGTLFNLPAGELQVALSAEWRRLGNRLVSDAQATDLMDCTGLRYCVPGSNLWASGSFSNRSQVYQTVSEGAVEVNAPLLKSLPLMDSLTVNGAVRYAHYNTNGGVWSWKGGLDWQIVDQLNFRATRSRDIRAPNLNDLYAPTTITRGAQVDLLTGQSLTNFDLHVGSNADLVPEVADTWTAGIVYRPSWLNGFSLAIDGYDTKIDNAIQQVSGATASVQNACYASGGTSTYCRLVVRPFGLDNRTPANNATRMYNIPINVAQLRTYGVDFEANYTATLFGRPASARLLVTWQPHLSIVTPGLSKVDMAGAAFGPTGFNATPSLRGTAFVNFMPLENFRVTIMQRWRNAMDWNGDATLVYAEPKIPATGYTNINLAYTVKHGEFGQSELFFNVQNLFNTAPKIGGLPGETPGREGQYPATDDAIGRYFTAGVRFRH